MSSERKPGGLGWKPSSEDVSSAQHPQPGLLLRSLSVIPFVSLGVLGVLAFVSWLAVLVFGVGTSRGAVWTWARGRSAGEVFPQVLLMLAIGAGCAAVIVLSISATMYGFRERQPWFFWPAAQVVFSALAVLLVVGRAAAPALMQELGLTGIQWWVVFALLAFAMTVVGLRMRRRGHDGGDGGDG